MAAGEWISVKSQVELFTGVLKDIRRLIAEDRPLLVDQLSDSLSKTGHHDATADKAAEEIAANDHHLMEAYARQVMGFNPDELGSPWVAAISSFVLFTVGAAAPIIPWFFGGGMGAVWASIILTALGSLIVGGYISLSSGKNIMRGAVRQFFIVVLASVVTYGIGYVFGVTTG